MDTKATQRRHDLDWLRILAFTGVFFYHSARFFNCSDWHIKNAETSTLIDIFTGIFELWGMPLIFMISGASIFFALRSGMALRFLRNRTWRLLVPLAFGILVLAPPQIYLTRLTHGEFQGSFLEFLPLYFQDWRIGDGNFAWSGVHLWYLEDLFLFTLVLLPLFAALKRRPGLQFIETLGHLSARPGVIFLWSLPLAVHLTVIDPFGFIRPGLSEELTRLLLYPPFLVYGFLVFSNNQIQQAIIQQRRVALVLAFTLTMATPVISRLPGLDSNRLIFALVMLLASNLAWSSILAILGYGMRYLTTNHRLLAHANEGVLPFYVLHQPVILILGYFITPLPLPILAKYLIIALLAFSITLTVYEFGVRRVNFSRRLFGLKARRQVSLAADRAARPIS